MTEYYERIGTTRVTDPKKGNERFQAWQKEERKKIATHSYIGHWKWQSLADLTEQLPGMKVPVQLLSSARSGICPIEQLGRAPCRERECQSVQISVLGACVKKKKKKKRKMERRSVT